MGLTALAGDDVIHMTEDVDWKAGDHLVVSSSETDMNQNEKVVVEAVLSPRKLRLTAPLRYTHRASVYSFEGSFAVAALLLAQLSLLHHTMPSDTA